jgi:GNAT superfamily N-acetyltransferase
LKIVCANELSNEKLVEFFTSHWGSPEMVISTGVYDCSKLDGFAILDENQITGLVTYMIRGNECEIISLDSLVEGKGFGTALVYKVEEEATKRNCSLVKLITTNDNLNALKFYQKRGYVLSNIYCNAATKARRIKPQIPIIGYDGIPIRDEIELKKMLL